MRVMLGVLLAGALVAPFCIQASSFDTSFYTPDARSLSPVEVGGVKVSGTGIKAQAQLKAQAQPKPQPKQMAQVADVDPDEGLTPMVFRQTKDCTPTCVTTLIGTGDFASNTHETLKTALVHTGATRVMFDSPGGILRSGLMAGIVLRASGADTALEKGMRCYSACAYAFLGGVRRDVRDGGMLGLHRFYSDTQHVSSDDIQEVSQTLLKYITGMGVKREVMDLANGAGKEEMLLIDTPHAIRLGMDNTVRALNDWSWSLKAQESGNMFLIGGGQSENNDRTGVAVIGMHQGVVMLQMGVREPPMYSDLRNQKELNAQNLQLMVCRYNRTQPLIREQCVFGEPIEAPKQPSVQEINGMFTIHPKDLSVLLESQGNEAIEFFLFGGPEGKTFIGNMSVGQKVFASSIRAISK